MVAAGCMRNAVSRLMFMLVVRGERRLVLGPIWNLEPFFFFLWLIIGHYDNRQGVWPSGMRQRQ